MQASVGFVCVVKRGEILTVDHRILRAPPVSRDAVTVTETTDDVLPANPAERRETDASRLRGPEPINEPAPEKNPACGCVGGDVIPYITCSPFTEPVSYADFSPVFFPSSRIMLFLILKCIFEDFKFGG